MHNDSKKKLAVTGGGAAGHRIAYDLRDRLDVTLIDPKTYWEVPMALPRLLVEPDALPARLSHASFLRSAARHVQGHAVQMTDHSVVGNIVSATRSMPNAAKPSAP